MSLPPPASGDRDTQECQKYSIYTDALFINIIYHQQWYCCCYIQFPVDSASGIFTDLSCYMSVVSRKDAARFQSVCGYLSLLWKHRFKNNLAQFVTKQQRSFWSRLILKGGSCGWIFLQIFCLTWQYGRGPIECIDQGNDAVILRGMRIHWTECVCVSRFTCWSSASPPSVCCSLQSCGESPRTDGSSGLNKKRSHDQVRGRLRAPLSSGENPVLPVCLVNGCSWSQGGVSMAKWVIVL